MTSAFHGRRLVQQLWAKQILDALEFIHSKCCPSKSRAGQYSGELIEYELWWIINQVLKWRNIPFCFLLTVAHSGNFHINPVKRAGWAFSVYHWPLHQQSDWNLDLETTAKLSKAKNCPMTIWARMLGSHVGYYSDFITNANNTTTQHITSLIFHFVRYEY